MGGKNRSVTVGYKYLLGMHAIICQSPIDALLQLDFGDRRAWGGSAKNKRISIVRNNLFGGKAREGGVSGFIDVEGGEPTQNQNDYLASRLDGLVPNFRGVFSLVFRQFYWGNNPYIKAWRAKVRNVFNTFGGDFERKLAPINPEVTAERTAILLCLDNSTSMANDNKGFTAEDAAQALIASIPNSDNVAIGVILWSSVVDRADFFYKLDPSTRFDLLATWLAYNYTGSGTNYDAAFSQADTFFTNADNNINVNPSEAADIVGAASGGAGVGTSSGNDPLRRILFFVTDGQPVPQSSFDDALATIQGLDDVEIFAVSIGNTDTTFTDPIDTSGVATVIEGGDTDALTSIFESNFSSFVDLNPAHIIRDVLINPSSDGFGDPSIIGTSFNTAAQTLFNEGFGLSFFWNNPSSKEAFKQQLESHIDARVFFDRANGTWEIKLIRPDYNVGDLFTFDQTTILDWTQPPETPKIWELPNQITLVYTRRDNGKEASVTVTNVAGIQATGSVINEKVEMKGITWPPLANTVAQRELQARGLPITRGAFRAAYAPVDLNPGDAFTINEPRVNLNNLVARVIEIEEGDGVDNSVIIRFATDVFSLNPVDGSFATDDVGTPENFTALAPNITVAFELPYYDALQRYGESEFTTILTNDNDAGYWAAGCDDPGSNHISAQISESDGTNFLFVASAPFAPTFQLTSNLGRLATDTTFTATETGRENEIAVGDLLLIDEEFVRVDSITIANGIATFTVGRGCLDTVPTTHGAARYAVAWQDYVLGDDVEYTAGEYASVKVAPATRSETFPIDQLTAENITFDSRAFRPYGPGQLQIESSYDPGIVVGDVTATWVHRNRLTQTTANVEDHTSGNIALEAEVSYRAVKRLYRFNSSDFFALTDVYDLDDWYIDYDSFTDEIADVDSPSDGTSHVFNTDDKNFFSWTDVFAQADWYLDSFVPNSIRFGLGIRAVREMSPEYVSWQTPFVLSEPLLPAINLTAVDE